MDDLGRDLFDATFSRFGVIFFSESEAAFAQYPRHLKPGGTFAALEFLPINCPR
jgi:ubiquinone/menaquinone biosynthesis C-methylase UbiE